MSHYVFGRLESVESLIHALNLRQLVKYFLFHLVQQNKTPILECVRRLILKTDTLYGPLRCALCVPLRVWNILLRRKSYTRTLYIFDRKYVVDLHSFGWS